MADQIVLALMQESSERFGSERYCPRDKDGPIDGSTRLAPPRPSRPARAEPRRSGAFALRPAGAPDRLRRRVRSDAPRHRRELGDGPRGVLRPRLQRRARSARHRESGGPHDEPSSAGLRQRHAQRPMHTGRSSARVDRVGRGRGDRGARRGDRDRRRVRHSPGRRRRGQLLRGHHLRTDHPDGHLSVSLPDRSVQVARPTDDRGGRHPGHPRRVRNGRQQQRLRDRRSRLRRPRP